MSRLSGRVLFVEENISAARQLEKQLRAIPLMQMDIIHVKELHEALARLDVESFDVVLLSLSLSGITGIDAIRRIQTRNPRVPVVALAGAGKGIQGIDFSMEDMPEFLIEKHDNPKAVFLALHHTVRQRRREKALLESEQNYHELVEELELMVERRTEDLELRSLQLRAMAAELTHAEERERKRLAQALHDDLQQLLVGAKFCAETLIGSLQKTTLKEAMRRLVQFLNDAIESARSLTFELSPPILHNASLAQSLHHLGEKMNEKHGLTVTVKADEQAEPEHEDIRTLLFQAVRELLFNVVKHARVKTAGIETQRLGEGFIQIAVFDSGVGFDTEKCGQERRGSGFGLFNIRERLGTVGGRLDVQSVPGSGCHCIITVPLGRRIPGGQPGSSPAPAFSAGPRGGLMRAGRKIRVLVADSLSVVRQEVIRLLEEHNDILIVGEASDGEEALDLARKVSPDVILLEMNLPRLSGIETTLRLKKEFPQVKVIGLSSGEELEGDAAIRDVGACAVLDKKSRLQTLASIIRSSFSGAA